MLWAVGENAREGYMRVHRPEFFKYLSLLADLGDSDSGKKIIEASMQKKRSSFENKFSDSANQQVL